MGDPILSCTGIHKTFEYPVVPTHLFQDRMLRAHRHKEKWHIHVLKDISLAIAKGEWVGIYGPNGSGKTTLLKILGGLLEADAGTVDRQGHLSCFFTLGVGFHPERLASENIYFHGLLHGMSPQETTGLTEQVIDFAGVRSHMHLPLKCYSTGLQMRLAFAAMVHVDADVYLLDEVLAVGDKDFQEKCKAHMQSMRTAGKSAVLVLHDEEQLKSFCDRIVYIDGGCLGREESVRSPRREPFLVKKREIFAETSGDLYLDLLKRCLLDSLYLERGGVIPSPAGFSGEHVDVRELQCLREEGRDWPRFAHTMIGLRRLESIEECIRSVLQDNIPGDLLEAGVWRGGATIFMRGMLKAHNSTDRVVWVVDSFEGLPSPNPKQYPADMGSTFHLIDCLRVDLSTVQENFRRYGLLDQQVCFLPGWFHETLPSASIDRLAVLRIDADMYESTLTVLENLYPKLSIGGYVIIDDYGCLAPCRKAVMDYRHFHGIREEIISIDWAGVLWRKLHVVAKDDSTHRAGHGLCRGIVVR